MSSCAVLISILGLTHNTGTFKILILNPYHNTFSFEGAMFRCFPNRVADFMAMKGHHSLLSPVLPKASKWKMVCFRFLPFCT